MSIRLHKFPHWIFPFVDFLTNCWLLSSSANLRVATTSVRTQPCFNIIVWISHLPVMLLEQKGVGTRSHTKQRCGNAVPTPLHPWTRATFRSTSKKNNVWGNCACYEAAFKRMTGSISSGFNQTEHLIANFLLKSMPNKQCVQNVVMHVITETNIDWEVCFSDPASPTRPRSRFQAEKGVTGGMRSIFKIVRNSIRYFYKLTYIVWVIGSELRSRRFSEYLTWKLFRKFFKKARFNASSKHSLGFRK